MLLVRHRSSRWLVAPRCCAISIPRRPCSPAVLRPVFHRKTRPICLAVPGFATSPSLCRRACLWLPAAMSILQKIEEIEAEMAKTQKNKATAYVLGRTGMQAFLLYLLIFCGACGAIFFCRVPHPTDELTFCVGFLKEVTTFLPASPHYRTLSILSCVSCLPVYPRGRNHLGGLKAKLAKLRRELIAPPKSGGGGGEGFEVTKTGDARVGLVGFPSVGKSTLLTKLTGTTSEVAAYGAYPSAACCSHWVCLPVCASGCSVHFPFLCRLRIPHTPSVSCCVTHSRFIFFLLVLLSCKSGLGGVAPCRVYNPDVHPRCYSL